jgi:hypothetical protein
MPSNKILFMAMVIVLLFFLCGIMQGAVIPADSQSKLDILLNSKVTTPTDAIAYAVNFFDMITFNYPEIFSGGIGTILWLVCIFPMGALAFMLVGSWVRGVSSS